MFPIKNQPFGSNNEVAGLSFLKQAASTRDLLSPTNASSYSGQGGIWTPVGVSRQIYSLIRLTTPVPTQFIILFWKSLGSDSNWRVLVLQTNVLATSPPRLGFCYYFGGPDGAPTRTMFKVLHQTRFPT